MNVNYSQTLSDAFVVRSNNLKKLVELLERRIGTREIDIQADCIDEIQRQFNTVTEVIAYENSTPKRIRSIHLSVQSEDASKSSARISFREPSWLIPVVSIDITGPEDIVSRLRDEILEVTTGMRPWYHVFAHIDFLTIFGVGIVSIVSLFAIATLFGWVSVTDAPSSDSGNVKADAFLVVFSLISSFVFWGLYRLRNYLFPRIVFIIGQQESRFKLLEKIRWLVICLLVPPLFGIIIWIVKVITT